MKLTIDIDVTRKKIHHGEILIDIDIYMLQFQIIITFIYIFTLKQNIENFIFLLDLFNKYHYILKYI